MPAADAWAALTDWAAQSDWIPLTTVRADGSGPAARIVARTGLGPFGFVDEMIVTGWDPPRQAVVDKIGAVLGGRAGFAVEPLRPDRCRVIWWEDVRLRWAVVSAPLLALSRPLVGVGIHVVLGRFRRRVEASAAEGAGRPC